MDKQHENAIKDRRNALLVVMTEYMRTMQLPLHLTGEALRPPEELTVLQEIWRLLLAHRDALGTFNELYRCPDCEHFEGERHATDCPLDRHVAITRPRNWTPAPVSTPVELIDLRPDPCPVAGCIYMQLPGTGFCAQHQVEH